MLRELLENRTSLILTVLLCTVLSLWSWLSIRRVQLPENPASIFGLVSIFFYALLIFGIASVAYRSRFWGDRVVFGLVAGLIALISIKDIVPLTPQAMLVVNLAKSSMLTSAALVSLSVLVGGSGTPLGKKSVRRN